MSTYTVAITYTHTVTYVTTKMLLTLKEIIREMGSTRHTSPTTGPATSVRFRRGSRAATSSGSRWRSTTPRLARSLPGGTCTWSMPPSATEPCGSIPLRSATPSRRPASCPLPAATASSCRPRAERTFRDGAIASSGLLKVSSVSPSEPPLEAMAFPPKPRTGAADAHDHRSIPQVPQPS